MIPVTPNLTSADVVALIDDNAFLSAAEGGDLTPDAGGHTLTTVPNRDTYWTLATGSSITTPIVLAGTGSGVLHVVGSVGGTITLPSGTLLGDVAIPTGAVKFDVIWLWNAKSSTRSVYIGNLVAIL